MKTVFKKNKLMKMIEVFYLIITLLSIFVCALYADNAYKYMCCLPLTFIICYLLVLLPNSRKNFTVKIISLCAFLRYVILPFFQSICPIYSFSNYATQNLTLISKAIALMCYELVFICGFIKCYFFLNHPVDGLKNVSSTLVQDRFTISKNRFEIILTFSLCVCLYSFINPRLMHQISFLFIKSNTSVRMGVSVANSNSFDIILRQVFVTAILSLFVITTTALRRKLYIRYPKISFEISIVLAIICTCMIISEQRSSQIYCAFATIILLVQLYPEKRRSIIITIGIFAGIALIMLSIYKMFYAFMYASYSDALENSNLGISSIVQTLEVYFLGPLTVASALQFTACNSLAFTASQLFFDISRSTIGISFFLKNSDKILTSVAYNKFVTGGRASSGYLLPITGQGYAFLGFVFAPVLICLFLYLAFKLEKIIFNSQSTYVVFFVAYVYIRVATCMISSNLNSVLVALSTVGISAGVIFLLQYILMIVRKKR